WDDAIRHIVNNDDGTFRDGGYVNKTVNGEWAEANNLSAQQVLYSQGLGGPQVKAAMGFIKKNPWYEINDPYAPQYSGERNWNRYGARLRYAKGEPGPTVHWDRVFDHCGEGLND